MGVNKDGQNDVENNLASTVDVNATVVDAPSTTDDQKKSMVAEQIIPYFSSIAISYNRVIRTL